MDLTQIVIQQPYGTTLVTIDVPAGSGELDSNIGENVLEVLGFGFTEEGIAYFQAGGANPGEQAVLGLSGDGVLSLTRAGVPGGAFLAEGTHRLIEQPSGPDPHAEQHVAGVHAPIPQPSGPDPHAAPHEAGVHAPIPKPTRPLSRLTRRLRRKRTDNQ